MTDESKLNAERVTEVFLDCLFPGDPGEHEEFIPIVGITQAFGLVPEKIDAHRDEINGWFDELPDEFRENFNSEPAPAGEEGKKGGGGWSFLNACYDKHGRQWTGFHKTMQELFVLGMATGKTGYVLAERELWGLFAGGMPYFVVYDEPKVDDIVKTTKAKMKEMAELVNG